jgi:hypothetical protein
VRIRWPFAAALGVFLLAVAAWVAYPHARAAWHNHQEASKNAAFLRANAPTMEALASLQLPKPAYVPCTSWPESGAASVCWRGSPAVATALADVKQAIQAAGGTVISTPCRTLPRIGLMCGVNATFAGRDVEGHVGPQISGKGGVYRYFGSDVSLTIFADPLANN